MSRLWHRPAHDRCNPVSVACVRTGTSRNVRAQAQGAAEGDHPLCGATKARPREPLPATFKPVAVVRCYSKTRGVNGHGLWRFTVKQQADHRLAAFIAALRRPSVRTPAGEACPAIGYLDPPFALVDRHGRILRPTLPATECGRPFQAAITGLEHLPWVTVSVRRTVQIATRAELLAGCDPKYGDVIASGSYFLQPQLSA